MRALELCGFRPEHWGYDYPDCYDEFNDKLKKITINCKEVGTNSLLLGGVVGTGKTAMLAILCKVLYKHYIHFWPDSAGSMFEEIYANSCKYCTHGELTASWENEFNENSDLPTENYFKQAPILFLDDLFAAQVNQSGRNIAKLEELIDWRWSNRLKTFLATNISLEDLWRPTNKQYHRIARRLSEKDWIFYQKLIHQFNVDKLK